MNDIISQDIDRILLDTSDIWTNFSNANIFITGGTGYFGIWMLITFIEANRRFNLGANAYVLTRSPERFAACFPKVAANPSLHMISGDVRFFDFPKGDFSYVIHFAADASAQFNVSAPREMLETIVIGGHHVLEFARHANVKALLFASSGAVYGSLPSSINRVSEDYKGGPDIGDFRSAYGEGKRVVELMCNIAVNEC
jgi:nucleoside-diphosphate-sugar epimerase